MFTSIQTVPVTRTDRLLTLIPCFVLVLSLCPDLSISHMTPHHMNAVEISVQFVSPLIFFFKHLIWCICTTVCSMSMFHFWQMHFQLMYKCSHFVLVLWWAIIRCCIRTDLIHSWRFQPSHSCLASFQISWSWFLYAHYTITFAFWFGGFVYFVGLWSLLLQICIWSWPWSSQLWSFVLFFPIMLVVFCHLLY